MTTVSGREFGSRSSERIPVSFPTSMRSAKSMIFSASETVSFFRIVVRFRSFTRRSWKVTAREVTSIAFQTFSVGFRVIGR